MKKLYVFCICIFISMNIDAQITTGRVRWKSASNISYIYTGELKDGKPHGRGLAISEPTGNIHVFGEFKNGMIDGSTVVRHSNGRIVVAKWKENKPEGTGVLITPENVFQYGNFVNGQLEGKVIRIQDDNRIIIDFGYKNGASYGRSIVINSNGLLLADKLYIDDTANGQGYQYEAKDKQKFEGIWEKGEWVRASTGNYPSFMRNPDFGSVVTENNISIYSDVAEKDNKKTAHDTCFGYDFKNNNRWFGYFDHGEFRNGVILTGDNIRTIGQFDAKASKQGFCVEYKKGRYLNMANYKDHKLDGNGIAIDIVDSTIYDGYFSADNYTGSAARLMKNKEIRIGNFIKGKLDGEGKTIYPDGRSVSGTYKDGLLTRVNEVIMPNRQKLDTRPKDVCTAVNFLLKEYANDFKSINSGNKMSVHDFNPRYNTEIVSFYSFPGASDNILGVETNNKDEQQHHEFYTGIVIYKDLESVKKPYDDLCTQLKNCNITSLQKGKILKLVPMIKPLVQENFEAGELRSVFSVPVHDTKKTRLIIMVWVGLNHKDGYELGLNIAEE